MLVAATDEVFGLLIDGQALPGLTVAEGGLESAETLRMLRGVAAEVRAAFDPASFLMVEDGEVVGMVSLLYPPDDSGVVTIGYGVAASRRGRGVGRRAVGDLVAWACGRGELAAMTAETSVDNVASQLVLERNGFARVGTRVDDGDGELICWRIELPRQEGVLF